MHYLKTIANILLTLASVARMVHVLPEYGHPPGRGAQAGGRGVRLQGIVFLASVGGPGGPGRATAKSKLGPL